MRNIGLHTVLYFLTERRVANSSEVELNLFIEACIKLAKSLIIYSEEELLFSQEVAGTIAQTPSDYRYIKHLAGQYDNSDLSIKPSLDVDILSMSRSDLYAKYPGYEVLIDGMKNPVVLTELPKNMKILHHDSSLISQTETMLLTDLQKLLYNYEARWNVSNYGIIDKGYVLSYRFILSLNIVTMLLSIRDSYRNTNQAADFHIKQHLAGYGRLDRFFKYYSRKQKLWLYRNIRNVIKNSGTEETHNALIKVLFVDGGYDIKSITYNRRSEVRGERVNYKHILNSVNPAFPSRAISARAMKGYTDEVATYNKDVHFDEVNELGHLTLQNNQETKFLYLKIENQTAITVPSLQTKLNYWLYTLKNDVYSTVVDFVIKTTDGERTLSIDPRTGYILFMLLVCEISGESGDLHGVIDRTAGDIQVDSITFPTNGPTLTASQVAMVSDSLTPRPSDLNPQTFRIWTDKLIGITDGVTLRSNAFPRMEQRLAFRELIAKTTEDHVVSLDIDAVINMHLIDNIKNDEEKARLLSRLLISFTGLRTATTGEELTRAAYFVDVYKQLSSYDTEIILDGSIVPPKYAANMVPTALAYVRKVRNVYSPCNAVPTTNSFLSMGGKLGDSYSRVKLSSSVTTRYNKTTYLRTPLNSRITKRTVKLCKNNSRLNFNRDF